MAGAESVVLFQREDEEEYDSDVWDDTALIEAYDAAVAPLKAKLAEHTGDASILEGAHKQTRGVHHKKKKSKKKKSKKKQQVVGWRVGDHCQAVYTEDGEAYEGKIISVSPETNTCVVRYLGYGNEEEQNLEDLLPSAVSASKRPKDQRNDSISCSETDSVDTPRYSVRGSHRAGGKVTRGSSSQPSSTHNLSWPWSSFAAPANMPPPPPLGHPAPPPPMFPGMPLTGFSVPHPGMNSAASMHLPTMPPPPPPMPMDEVPDENEALCSMLLSWYMSGYHTGYYQGLRQGRQCEANGSAASAMGPTR